jgi:hypothetical protein
MSQQNAFKPMDLVQNPDGEIFFVDQKKPDESSLYGALSLSRPEMALLDVSDREARRLCSIEDLPTAVLALLRFRAQLGRGNHSLGRFESTIINVIDRLQTAMDDEEW